MCWTAPSAEPSSSRRPPRCSFPTPMPIFEEYTQGFGLTEREFKLIKEQLEPGSRMFLVKQAHHSVVCQLDLKGFDAELAVISGRADAGRAHVPDHVLDWNRSDRLVTPIHGGERPLTGATTPLIRQEIHMLTRTTLLATVLPGGFDGNRAGCSGAMGGHRCASHRAAGPGSSDPAAAIGDRTAAAAIGPASAAGHDRRSRHGTLARRHCTQLLAVQLDAGDRCRAGTRAERLSRTVGRRAERPCRQCRAVAAALGHAVSGRPAANSSGASVERHAAGSDPGGARERERPVRLDSKPDRRHRGRRRIRKQFSIYRRGSAPSWECCRTSRPSCSFCIRRHRRRSRPFGNKRGNA